MVLIGCVAVAASGCAFNLVSVHQQPTQFSAVAGNAKRFVLGRAIDVSIGTGFPTRLHAGTAWEQSGRIPQGDVFTTLDQVVTVEASNISEAQLVVSDGKIVGFYLKVERTFAAASSAYPLQL